MIKDNSHHYNKAHNKKAKTQSNKNFFKSKNNQPKNNQSKDNQFKNNKSKQIQNYSKYGASFQRETVASWHAIPKTVDEDIVYNLPVLRARSRDAFMGSPMARAVIKRLITNVIGTGLKPDPCFDLKVLNLDTDKGKELEDSILNIFNIWADSTSCDATNSNNFYELQALAFQSAITSGDCFVALPLIQDDAPFDLKIYLIESDRVKNPSIEDFDKDIKEGVEVDKYGRPVAFYIANKNPKNKFIEEIVRVNAIGPLSKRKQILPLIPEMERPNQRRGVPFLAGVLEMFKQVERYTSAELQAAVVSGLFAGFITSQKDAFDPLSDSGLDSDEFEHEKLSKDNLVMGSGTLATLPPGQDIKFADPGRPNDKFGGFVDNILKQVGASTGIPFEVLILCFNSSYSASKASLMQAEKLFAFKRKWIVDNFCQPIWEEFITYCINNELINVPNFHNDFKVRHALFKCQWNNTTTNDIDELKAVKASMERINAGLSTFTKEAQHLSGENFENIASQLKKEFEMLPDHIKDKYSPNKTIDLNDENAKDNTED